MNSQAGNFQSISMEFIANIDLYEFEKPYNVSCGAAGLVPSEYMTNIETEWHDDIQIQDVRGHEHTLSFNQHGFKYLIYDSKLGLRFDEKDMKQDLEEATELLRAEIAAEKAICYDIRIRASDAARNCELVSEDRSKYVKPVTMAHTDHTREGGMRRIARHLTAEERKKYLTGNYHCRIFNLWKPLIEVIEDNPLAICVPGSVGLGDILAVDRVTEDWAGEIYFLKHNPRQEWMWLSKQKRNEICAFVTFDSQASTRLNFCPHTSFLNPSSTKDAQPRKSVEIRLITFNRVAPGTGAVYTGE